MLIGMISDSHGRAERTAAAVSLLREQNTELLIHLGDLETEAVIDELVGHPVRLVFGNCDYDLDGLTRYARRMGIIVDHPMGIIDADGKRVAYTHGHIEQCLEHALESGVEYLLHGHSHEIRDDIAGPTRILNPGAIFRAKCYTVALLDTSSDTFTTLELPRDTPPR